MTLAKTLLEMGLIVSLSLVTALLVNSLSPRGIALMGQWDVNRGVISAVSKNDAVVHKREIQRVADAHAIYMSGDALFVDARDDDSYAEGHIKGAAHLFVYEYDMRIEAFLAAWPERERLIVTYCSGRECEDSHMLAQYLEDEGYTNVKVFTDGFPAWEKEGLPIEANH